VFGLPFRFVRRQWRKSHPPKKNKKAAIEPPTQAS
jgi:hypothetical protein